jgi:maltose alpha-D-glucosyltransferase/alpha-amylase
MGVYAESSRLLGRRTAELHRALAGIEEPSFRPEPFTRLYQRSLYQSMRNRTAATMRLLAARARALPVEARLEAEETLARRDAILALFQRIRERGVNGSRIRIHGDYRLGQVLYTGKDFVVIDFEGEPARPLSERRLKRSPLRDVAGMARSFHYAACAAIHRLRERGLVDPAGPHRLDEWARWWSGWATDVFLAGYLQEMDGTGGPGETILPSAPEDRRLLLEVFMLEKALYELRYEMENRPGWLGIPLEGVRQLIEPTEGHV